MEIIEMPRFEAIKNAVPVEEVDLGYANKVWLEGIKERMLAKNNAYSLFGCDFGSKPSFSSMPATMAFIKEPYDGEIKNAEVRVAGVPGVEIVEYSSENSTVKERGHGGYNH